MARRLPPAPKERAVSLAPSGAFRAPAPILPPARTPPRRRITEDDLLLYGFFLLVVLGLILSTRAVLVL